MRISDWSSDVCSSDLHDILRARHHRLRGELDRLLRRTALAVDRHRGDRVGELRGEHRVAADVHRLLTALRNAAGDDVADLLGVEVVAVGARVAPRGAEADGMDAGEPSPALAPGTA